MPNQESRASSPTIVRPLPGAAPGATPDARTWPASGAWTRRLTLPIACALLIGSAALGLVQQQPPALPARAGDPGVISTRRALAHVERIATEPHPTDSPAAAQVRAYITSELTARGLTPVEQSVAGIRRLGPGQYRHATVRNVLTRWPGRASTRAVLLMAHYDSAQASPGASDNGSAVAALLETARVLREGPPLRNDVILLFPDSEESGLAGAEAFVTKHPWARDVGAAVNFDARGTSGPSLMFETSRGNGWLIDRVFRQAPFPRASSLYADIYRVMPNGTDLTVVMDRGIAGLNFAFVERPGVYHSSGDTVAALDRDSLHHLTSNAVSMARALGDADLRAPVTPDAVYFTLGNLLIVTPRAWQLGFAAFAVLLLAAQLAFAVRYRNVRWLKLGLALLAIVAGIAAACGVAYGAWELMRRVIPAMAGPGLRLYVNAAYEIGIVLVCTCVALGTLALLRRRMPRQVLMLAGVSAGVLIMLLLLVYLPGGSYLLLWPSIASLLCVAWLLRYGDRAFWGRPLRDATPCRGWDAAACVLMAMPSALLIAPVVHIMFVALGMRAVLPVAFLVASALALAVPLLIVLSGASTRAAATWLGAAAVVTLAAGAAAAGPGPTWPRHNSVYYARSLDEHQAAWATNDAAVDEWTAQFVGSAPPRGAALACLAGVDTAFHRATSLRDVPAASVTLVRNDKAAGTRVVELEIASGTGAGVSILNRSPKTPPVFLTQVGSDAVVSAPPAPAPAPASASAPTPKPEPFVVLNARASPGEPLRVRFETPSPEELRFTVFDAVATLPPNGAAPRPAWMVSGGGGRLFNETSVTCRTMTVDALSGGFP